MKFSGKVRNDTSINCFLQCSGLLISIKYRTAPRGNNLTWQRSVISECCVVMFLFVCLFVCLFLNVGFSGAFVIEYAAYIV